MKYSSKWQLQIKFSPYEISCFTIEGKEPELISDKIKQSDFWSNKEEKFIDFIDYIARKVKPKRRVVNIELQSELQNDIEFSKRTFSSRDISKYLDRTFSREQIPQMFDSIPFTCPEILFPINESTESKLYKEVEALRKENQSLKVDNEKFNNQIADWRQAFEYKSDGLNIFYTMIETIYMKDGKQIEFNSSIVAKGNKYLKEHWNNCPPERECKAIQRLIHNEDLSNRTKGNKPAPMSGVL